MDFKPWSWVCNQELPITTPISFGRVALVELLVVPLCFLYNCYGAIVYFISGLSLNAHNLLQAAIHQISTVPDFDNSNVNLTKCISCFLLNLELKTCFGLHVPIAAKRKAFCTYIMGGLRDTTFIRLIIYTVVPTWVYNVCNAWQRQRTNAFRPTRWLARDRNHVYIILLWIGQRDGKQALGSPVAMV